MHLQLFYVLSLVGCIVLTSVSVSANSLCPHPEGNRPALSFSLISFRPGELDRECSSKINRARALGFTSVTLIPTFAYDRSAQQISSQSSVSPGEIGRCLDLIAEVGMDLVYQPHLDAIETISGQGEAAWRALFEVHPDSHYRDIVFGDYLRWLAEHAVTVRADGSPRHSIVISAELERSVQVFSAEWVRFVRDLRGLLGSSGLSVWVPLGINPNWNPLGGHDPRQSCATFRQLVNEIDFVAPSMYGDWRQVSQGALQVESRFTTVRESLRHPFPNLCSVVEYADRPFSMGEFGVGRNLQSAEMRLPAVMTENFVQQRRAVYQNILSWGRAQASMPNLQPITIWTLGVFDPVGVQLGQDEVLADYEIAQMFREYSRDRCAGLVLPPLAATDFLQESSVVPTFHASQPLLTRLRIFLKPFLDRLAR